MSDRLSIEEIEIKLLFEGLALRYGYDFRGYAEASLLRRVRAFLLKRGLSHISQLQSELLHDRAAFDYFLTELTVLTSEMFRDPWVFATLREEVLPILKTYPVIRIWHAGCGGGEEIYSLAIMLQEEGLNDRSVIYATDINPRALERAKAGIFPQESVKLYTDNYQASGGKAAFSQYYVAAYGSVRFNADLRRNVVFSEHNLVTDDVFAEMNLILCRNVLVYFRRGLQERALEVFSRSLGRKGFLCLGTKENLVFLKGGDAFKEISSDKRIYRKLSPEGVRGEVSS